VTFLRRWWSRYWPWAAAGVWLIAYELYAAITKRRRTLSQLVWRARRYAPWLPWIVIPLVGLVLAHFFFGLCGPLQERSSDVSIEPDRVTVSETIEAEADCPDVLLDRRQPE